eukprot:409695_1
MMSMDIAFRYAIYKSTDYDKTHPLYEKSIDLFINKNGLPDGSALYGITLNDEGHGENIIIKNVSIHDLKISVAEIPAMYFDKCDDDSDSVTVLKGPFGDVMDIRKMINSEFIQLIDEYDIHNKDLNDIKYEG